MTRLQPVRGTRDLIGEEARRFLHVVRTFEQLAEVWGFDPIATPIFEFTPLFARTLGEASDVVTKEMYSFTDRSGDSLTLRPEYTAGIARAWISNGLATSGIGRFYAWGPMFRHERPQKGRYRQFHQLDVEIIGSDSPLADAELIALGHELLTALDVADDVTLHINSLGTPACRARYREALVGYLAAHADRLSADSRARLKRNPLRILDSKDEGDRAIVARAPRLAEFLDEEARAFYRQVKEELARLDIPFVEDPYLVRGLDYYTHTAFEFMTDRLGAQGTVLGGGRYDGLIEQLGGPATPGVGWAAGIERLAMLLAATPAPAPTVALVPLGDEARTRLLSLARTLRRAGIRTLFDYRGNLKKRMGRAARAGARYAVVFGEEELAGGSASVKDLAHGTQESVAFDRLADWLHSRLATGSDRRADETG
ncbi:MAG: histidine--tRNA ligase [Alphaproteobacteria bacterium]|nr:MAG: histidine--tRNA ligase [Alphaproteobacteria bacterium]